jgi:hypothetical protein
LVFVSIFVEVVVVPLVPVMPVPDVSIDVMPVPVVPVADVSMAVVMDVSVVDMVPVVPVAEVSVDIVEEVDDVSVVDEADVSVVAVSVFVVSSFLQPRANRATANRAINVTTKDFFIADVLLKFQISRSDSSCSMPDLRGFIDGCRNHLSS